jgi:hypothetical protein
MVSATERARRMLGALLLATPLLVGRDAAGWHLHADEPERLAGAGFVCR